MVKPEIPTAARHPIGQRNPRPNPFKETMRGKAAEASKHGRAARTANEWMPPRLFWFGLLPVLVILAAWWDSGRHGTSLHVSMKIDNGLTMSLSNGAGAVTYTLHDDYWVMPRSGAEVTRGLAICHDAHVSKPTLPFFADGIDVDYSSDVICSSTEVSVAHWLVLIAYMLLWLAVLWGWELFKARLAAMREMLPGP